MTVVTEPFPLVPGQLADANQLEADIALMRTVINGQLEMGVNVQAGSSSAIDGDSSSPGSSNQEPGPTTRAPCAAVGNSPPIPLRVGRGITTPSRTRSGCAFSFRRRRG
jgi:hypothetical protein